MSCPFELYFEDCACGLPSFKVFYLSIDTIIIGMLPSHNEVSG